MTRAGGPRAPRGAGAAAPAAITFDALVQPRASRARIGPRRAGRVKIAVTAPPVDGEANAAAIALIASAFGVPPSAVTVIAGASSRRKTLRVVGGTAARLAELAPDDAGIDAGTDAGIDAALGAAAAGAGPRRSAPARGRRGARP